MFEGEKVRAEQQKRIDDEVHENRVPPIPERASDKESALHVDDGKQL